jgi:hypothetical protein
MNNSGLPKEMLDPAILSRFLPSGNVRLATQMDTSVLTALFADTRIARLADNEATHGSNAYTPADLVDDVTRSVWTELDQPKPTIDIYRRTIQRAYLSTLDAKLNGPSATNSEIVPLVLDAAKTLAKRIDKALAKTSDPETYAHLLEARRKIELMVQGKTTQVAAYTPIQRAVAVGLEGADDQADDCWSDPLHDAFKGFFTKQE